MPQGLTALPASIVRFRALTKLDISLNPSLHTLPAALPPPKMRYQLTPEDIMSGRVVSASAVPASPIAVQQRDPGCPTAADVMATNASDRWAVWDSFPEGSLCRLDTSECGTTAPADGCNVCSNCANIDLQHAVGEFHVVGSGYYFRQMNARSIIAPYYLGIIFL